MVATNVQSYGPYDNVDDLASAMAAANETDVSISVVNIGGGKLQYYGIGYHS